MISGNIQSCQEFLKQILEEYAENPDGILNLTLKVFLEQNTLLFDAKKVTILNDSYKIEGPMF